MMMIRFLILLFILTRAEKATAIEVCSFYEGNIELKIPSSKLIEKDNFLKENIFSQSKLEDIHKPFRDAWKSNNVAVILDLYEQWMCDSRFSNLLGFFFFPADILDSSECTSYTEHNEAVKLSILIAAKFNHLEARMIASKIFNDPRYSPEKKLKFEELHRNIRLEIESKAQEGDRESIELLLDSVLSNGNPVYIEKYLTLVEAYVTDVRSSHFVSTRTFLRLARTCRDIGESEKSYRYYHQAAFKGSKSAVSEIINGLMVAKHLPSQEKLPQINEILQAYQSQLSGFGQLLLAQYYQFGVGDIVERNLKKANSFYKTAADLDFPQACIDYGDFLLITTKAFPNNREKVRKFYELAINSYVKAGKLGVTNGYNKAAQTLLYCERERILSEEDLVSCRSRVFDLHKEILLITADPLLMKRVVKSNIENEGLNDIQQYQDKLQFFIKNTFESTFSLHFDEVD